jgi:hypothetical protein
MRSRWDAIHADLARSVHSERSARAFGLLRAHQIRLAQFANTDALLAKLGARAISPGALDEADAILAALIGGAALPNAGELAIELILLGLWPGLSSSFMRLGRLYEGRPNDLAADILGRFTECVRRLDVARCTRVAATLVRNTERVVRFARMLELKRGASSVATEESDPIVDSAAEKVIDLVDLRLWLRRTVPADGDLVFAIVASSQTCRQVAEAFGISYASARQRLVRAFAAIRRKIAQAAVTV